MLNPDQNELYETVDLWVKTDLEIGKENGGDEL